MKTSGSTGKSLNSWEEYWGKLGFFRILIAGNQLGIEKYGSRNLDGD